MKSDSQEEVKKQIPWQRGLVREKSGALSFAGQDLQTFLTHKAPKAPFYLLSLDVVSSRALAYQAALQAQFSQSLHFHFAMKSNCHPDLLKMLAKEGFGIDVVSGGEMNRAMSCGMKAGKIVFSGVAKSKIEIQNALKNKVGQLNVESFPELKRITEVAKTMGVKARVAVRLNPEVQAETHPYIATGFRENKFGVDTQDFAQIQEWIKAHPEQLIFEGLSLHIGSQLMDFLALEEALEKTLRLESELAEKGLKAQSLDVGGGVGISYQGNEEEDLQNLNRYVKSLKKALGNYAKPLHFEPGRFWSARAGVLIAQVEYVKRTPYKNFLILNVGMNALMRPALYQAYHRIEPLMLKKGEKEIFDVVGPVCESSDVLGKLREFSDPQEGDYICIGEVGAYGSVLSSNYNLLGEVPEIVGC